MNNKLFGLLSILALTVGLSVTANAVSVALSDYLIPDGMSWSYIFTHDTFGPDAPYSGAAGQEFTVTEQPFSRVLLDFFSAPPSYSPPPVVDTGILYQFEPSIYAYFEIITDLTVPEGLHNNVLRILWLDSNYTANPVNQFGYTGNDWGVTDVDWFATGIGQIKFLGVGAGSGVIDGGFELTSVVPVPAAVWLFGSGLIGLIGVARRRRSS